MSRLVGCCVMSLALACVFATRPAAAEPTADERATAQALFDDAKSLVQQGRVAEACPKFAESERLDPGIGTQFHLADCYERLKLFASAWTNFLEVASASKAAGQPDREAVARERAHALEPRLSRLVVDVPREARVEGLVVQRDTLRVGEALWGTALPVDIGKHTIVAAAPGRSDWRKEIAIEKEGESTTVAVPVLEVAHKSAPPEPPTSTTANVPAAPPPEADHRAENAAAGATQRTVAIAIASLGVAGLVIGSVEALGAKSDNNASMSHCRADNVCDEQGVALRDSALGKGTAATWLFIGSTALVGTAAVVWFTAPPSSGTGPEQRSARAVKRGLSASARLMPHSALISVGGAW